MENKNNLKLRNRFVDDFNLPISVLDSPYFEYQLKLYNSYNFANKKWQSILSLVNENYGGNDELFLEDYYSCREKIITSIENSAIYKEFITTSMEQYTVRDKEFNSIPKSSVYTEVNDKKYFLSIDLKHANFQGLRFYSEWLVDYKDNYQDFLKHHLGDNHPLLSYFNESKYTRQIIFGKLNMSRNVTIQNYMMYKIYLSVKNIIDNGKIVIHSKQSDELIFEIKSVENIEQFLKNIQKIQKTDLGYIDTRFELFQLNMHRFETSCGSNLSVYEKNTSVLKEINNELWVVNDDMNIGKIKSCPLTYFPQVYKLISSHYFNEEEICNEMDLVFYYEKNLCKFLKPIKKV